MSCSNQKAYQEPKMESFKNNPNQTKPKDTYKIAYMIHFLLGAGNLLPWNALITAIDYFGYLYPDKHVEKVFSVAYMSSSLLVLIVMIRWNNFRELVTFQVRMNIGFAMFVVSLMVTPTIDWAWQGVSMEQSDAAFCAVVASVWICGLADGSLEGGLIGSAGENCQKNICRQFLLGQLHQVSFVVRPTSEMLTLEVANRFLAENLKAESTQKTWRHGLYGERLLLVAAKSGLLPGGLLLYPLFTACLHGPIWLKNEVFVVFLTVILGFTNGYLTSVIMILTPKSVPPLESEMAAVVMA
ncbi:equilibrative nucleotide transporter 8-like protein [Tanacetum coccineum]